MTRDVAILSADIKERVTMALLEVIAGRRKEYRVMYEPSWMVIKTLKELGYDVDDAGDIDTNGWQVDYWITVKSNTQGHPILIISGCVYTGNMEVKQKDDHDED